MVKGSMWLTLLFAAPGLCGCTQSSPVSAQFAAGPNEKAFDVAYGYNHVLPVAEDEFLQFVKSRSLSCRVSSGEGAMDPVIEPPLLKRLDLKRIARTYDVYDAKNSDMSHKVHYSVYVDRANKVVYVENRFLYEGL